MSRLDLLALMSAIIVGYNEGWQETRDVKYAVARAYVILEEIEKREGELSGVLERFEKHSDGIFIRVGAQDVSLAEMPGDMAVKHVCRMLRERLEIPAK
jgi:hypothetical protein